MKSTTQQKRPPTRIDIANFYADTLMTLAEESFSYRAWRASLANLARLVESDEMSSLLRDPMVDKEDVAELMGRLLDKAEACEQEKRFVMWLVNKEHLFLAPLIRDQFIEMSNKALGIGEAHVVSAKPMTLREEIGLKKVLSERFNVRVKITKAVNEKLIAGYVIRIDDKTIDQSTRGYRKRMAKAHKPA